MNLIFFDDNQRDHLLPLVYTRPASEIRIGILTIREKWEKRLQTKTTSWLTVDYLSKKFPAHVEQKQLLINGRCLPSQELTAAIASLQEGEAIVVEDVLVAALLNEEKVNQLQTVDQLDELEVETFDFEGTVRFVNYTFDIFKENKTELVLDFELVTEGRESAEIDSSNTIIGDKSQLFLEEGASILASIINVTEGPVYLAKNASISEGCMVKGGLSLGESAQLKMGAKIYGASTFGLHCKVGGEVNNSVIFGYSNKGHDGFLGNSVLGEWCNLGADTNTSNLKNNYGEVSVYNYSEEKMVPTGSQFCGLVMGDHSKSGINTMFNTGTVAGVSANVFGGGFPAKMIPSFSWGGEAGFEEFRLEKAFEVADRMMSRRGIEFDEIEKEVLTAVFNATQHHRS